LLNPRGVYECVGVPPLSYSDGRDSEIYLQEVFEKARDLSSDSQELEGWIKDWPSEYHLSRKRTQLLKGFQFDSSASVLEVGCGCGAITRFLAETFSSVVSVDGNPERAALARQRCTGFYNVSLVSAPFQSLRFKRKFDILICVGVYEYSKAFVEGDDPFGTVLDYFADHLAEDGVLVLAIENQFGLKYFASASEDHNKVRYDGIEGYHRFSDRPQTFGYQQLKRDLLGYFEKVDYFFPFPDYKLPEAVLSESLFKHVDAAPLLAGFRSRDYLRPYRARFDERLAWEGLSANRQLPFFAHSFLVVANKVVANNKRPQQLVAMKDLGVLYNRRRAEAYHTRTRLYLDENGRVQVEKMPLQEAVPGDDSLELKPYTEPWIPGPTVHREVLERALDNSAAIPEIFLPAQAWYHSLLEISENACVDGAMIDAIWQNSLQVNGEVVHIDLEWLQGQPIALNTLLIRAIYWFLSDLRSYPMLARSLRWRTTASIIKEVADQFGAALGQGDMASFLEFETRLNSTAYGRSPARSRRRIGLMLQLPQRVIKCLLWGDAQFAAISFYASKARRLANRLYHDRLRPG